jgi:hypothetical protein
MYYFRGSINRNDAWAMTHHEREMAIEFINKKFKEAQKLIDNRISPSM